MSVTPQRSGATTDRCHPTLQPRKHRSVNHTSTCKQTFYHNVLGLLGKLSRIVANLTKKYAETSYPASVFRAPQFPPLPTAGFRTVLAAASSQPKSHILFTGSSNFNDGYNSMLLSPSTHITRLKDRRIAPHMSNVLQMLPLVRAPSWLVHMYTV